MNATKLKILELVKENNGLYSWYQIDRCLSETGVDHSGNLMTLLRELTDDGLIETEAGHSTAQPVYSITESGISMILAARQYDT